MMTYSPYKVDKVKFYFSRQKFLESESWNESEIGGPQWVTTFKSARFAVIRNTWVKHNRLLLVHLDQYVAPDWARVFYWDLYSVISTF